VVDEDEQLTIPLSNATNILLESSSDVSDGSESFLDFFI